MNILCIVPSFLQTYLLSQKTFSLLESVLSSKKDLKSIAAKGKGKQRNVIDNYSSEKFLEAKLGVKVICDVRGKTSFLNYQFGIGCFNFIGLLEDNYAGLEAWILFYLPCSILQYLGVLELWPSLKGGSAGYRFLYLDTGVVQATFESLSLY